MVHLYRLGRNDKQAGCATDFPLVLNGPQHSSHPVHVPPLRQSYSGSLYLHAEILSGQHQAGFAVPVVEPPIGGLWVEGTAVMFVKADYQADVVLATFNR